MQKIMRSAPGSIFAPVSDSAYTTHEFFQKQLVPHEFPMGSSKNDGSPSQALPAEQGETPKNISMSSFKNNGSNLVQTRSTTRHD